MDKMEDLPPQRRAEILAARLERSQRALSDAENALESRMKQLFRANQDLSLRETELARRLEVESALLLGALLGFFLRARLVAGLFYVDRCRTSAR